MKFGEILDVAKLPIVAIIGLNLLAILSNLIPFIGVLIYVLLAALNFFVFNPILLGWVGYQANRKYGADLAGGALAGFFASFVAGVVIVMAHLVKIILEGALNTLGAAFLGLSGGLVEMLVGLFGMATSVMGTAFSILSLPIYFGLLIIEGAVCGAIGAAVARRGAPQQAEKAKAPRAAKAKKK